MIKLQAHSPGVRIACRRWPAVIAAAAMMIAQAAVAQMPPRPGFAPPGAVPARTPQSSADEPLARAFIQAFGFNPLTPERMPRIVSQEGAVRRMPGFAHTVQAGRAAVRAPGNAVAQQEFSRRLNALLGGRGRIDVLSVVYYVMKESIREAEEIKRYTLERLQRLDAISDAMAAELQALQEASERLAQHESGDDGEADKSVGVQIRPRATGPVPGPVVSAPGRPGPEAYTYTAPAQQQLSRGQLPGEIARVEAEQESVRNERQRYASQFENANQKAAQYVNMMSNVLRGLDDAQKGLIRNLR
jgi:hypothetical protein